MKNDYVFTRAQRIEMITDEISEVERQLEATSNIDHRLIFAEKIANLKAEREEI